MNGVSGGLCAVVGSLLLAAVATADPRHFPRGGPPPPAGPPPPPRPPPMGEKTRPPTPARAPPPPVAPRPKAVPTPAPASAEIVSVTPAAASTVADDPELQRLLDKLSALSDVIGRNAQSADVWRTQLEQAGVLLQVAARSKADEQENWLRMAIDSYYSAAIQSPVSGIL